MRRRKLGRRHNGKSRIVGKLLNGLAITAGSGRQINQCILSALYIVFHVVDSLKAVPTVSFVQDVEGFIFLGGFPFLFRMGAGFILPFYILRVFRILFLFLRKVINRLKEEGVIVCGRRRSLLGTGLSLFR